MLDEIVAETAEIDLNQTSFASNTTEESLQIGSTVRQRSAPPDLKVVSWPPGPSLADVQYFAYENDWQVKPRIYVVDIGLDSTYQVRP